MRIETIASVGLLVCGCGAPPGEDLRAEHEGNSDSAGGEFVSAEREVLAEINIEDTTISFVKAVDPAGVALFSVEELAPTAAGFSVLDELVAGHGLTALEAFYAIAPEGVTAPPALLQEHAAQARALGRADVSVLPRVAFVPPVLRQKSVAGCEAFVFPASASREVINKRSANWVSGDQILDTNSTTRNVTLGICNESNQVIERMRSWLHQGGKVGRIVDGWYTLDPRWLWRWYDWNALLPETCDGLVCSVDAVSYRVYGSSTSPNQYHLKTGEVVARIR